jgi:glycosyltransferase involved in cell wall biosynthesis
LAENLESWGVQATIADGPGEDVDINHWMLYIQPWSFYFPAPGFFTADWSPGRSKHTAMITHVDDPLKLRIVKEAMGKVLDAAICMSRGTMAELVSFGIDPARLTWINPAHDGAIAPRRIVIGITSRLYPDGRKGEHLLLQVAESIRLDAFTFVILGDGWDDVAALLRNSGAEVELGGETGGYAEILRRLPSFDYYLYLGWDEGSMGTLDALAAGVRTIVTPQGFHLDLDGGITHAIRTAADLRQVFQGIASERQARVDSVKHLTWPEYARQHAEVWRAVRDHRPLKVDGSSEIAALGVAASRQRLWKRALKSDFLGSFIESRTFWVRARLSAVKQRIRRARTAR